MSRILVFGGTSDEHLLISGLLARGFEVTVSVVSELGRELCGEQPGLCVIEGRLSSDEMSHLMKSGQFLCVVDATHPYAALAGKNIAAAAKAAGLSLFRLNRNPSDYSGCLVAKDAKSAAKMLLNTEGNILLTTGSKELSVFCSNEALLDRIYARVLPTAESIAACGKAGIKASRIIAMQGPFSRELNCAIIRQFDIKTLVTKDGGSAGGMPQKLMAASDCGCRVLVIERPRDGGMNLTEVLDAVSSLSI